jgi:carboxyl-terminal processing protease
MTLGRRAWVPAILLLVAGLALGGWLLARINPADPMPQPTRLFEQVFQHVRRFGVDSLAEGELYRRAADGLLEELDDEYAMMAMPGETLVELGADPGGLGLQLATRDGRVAILSVLPDSPAERAGLRHGDQLLEVEGRPVEASRRDQVFAGLAGPPGTEVTIRVRRPSVAALAAFELVRERPRAGVVTPGIDLGGGVGYVGIRLLREGARDQLERQWDSLRERGTRRLVLDLRGASQGRLEEAVGVAGLFLPADQVVAAVRGRDPAPSEFRSSGPSSALSEVPLLLLVDSSTADAAEVLAGALQDLDRALVMGEPTFGRGMSQETFRLAEGVTVRMSTGRWQTPLGRPLQRDTAMSDTLSLRPRVATAGGREVVSGGGVVPDSLVLPDSQSAPAREFQRALGGGLPAYQAALRTVAGEIVKSAVPGEAFVPGGGLVLRLREVLAARGTTVPDPVWEAAVPAIAVELGDASVRLAGGQVASLRRVIGRDPLVKKAAGLLGAAAKPADLLFGSEPR